MNVVRTWIIGMMLTSTVVAGEKLVSSPFSVVAPEIDGRIDTAWTVADSIKDFIQFVPYEKTQPTESTVVYCQQDEHNLYIAFRCHSVKTKIVSRLGSNEDYVTILLDPFESKTTAYYFTVYASGRIDDGMVFDDGRSTDPSWNGVWFSAVKTYPDRYEVEIKIPFKTIRYNPKKSNWGINFCRGITFSKEIDYWTEVMQGDLCMVSQYGQVNPLRLPPTGYYFELYPEVYMKYDKERDQVDESKLRAGLNVKWDINPQSTLTTTLFPDFAQIESDPYSLNLSRYETSFTEKRPFFIEGYDIFRMPDFGGLGQKRPLNIFYTRRIGKVVNGEPIPIIGGFKYTQKTKTWDIGMVGAFTDDYHEDMFREPQRKFGAIRVKTKVFENSNIGMLCSGDRTNDGQYNYAAEIDGVFRSRKSGIQQYYIQGVFSDRNHKRGLAGSTSYSYFKGHLLQIMAVELIQDSFDVRDIGYVPWSGRKQFVDFTGYYAKPKSGILRDFCLAPGVVVVQEPGDKVHWSQSYFLQFNPTFRNGWNVYTELTAGPYYEAGLKYNRRSISASMDGSTTSLSFGGGGYYLYGYNYNQGLLAYQGSNWMWVEYNIASHLRPSLTYDNWVEWDTLLHVGGITHSLTPRLYYSMTKDLCISVFNEMVLNTPQAFVGKTTLDDNRLGFLFSWNFRPKSWFYVAYNDVRDRVDTPVMANRSRVGAIKASYLLYF